MVSTNVPQPTFGPNGFIVPSSDDVLAGVWADYQAAFENTLNEQLDTPQGQLVSSEAALVENTNDTFLFYTTQTDPQYATGRMQDAIARIYFIERIPSQPTTIQVDCVGLVGVSIPAGSLIQDASGNTYTCTQGGAITGSGSVTLAFANLIPGPIAIPETVTIYTSIPGWDTATVVGGSLGANVETRAQFEARRTLSVARNSLGQLNSVLGAVLSVPGVIDAFATENDTGYIQTIGAVTLVPNSIYVAVVGGEAVAVATAIWTRKAPGCAYNGNTSVVVYDENPAYQPPFPAYTVSFETPDSLPFLFRIEIANGPLVPENAATLIQNAILDAFAGGDGGPRAKIGATLFASRFYAPVALLGPWARIITIKVGSPNGAVANFAGAIAGTTLTVLSVSSGALAVGQTLFDSTGAIAAGTAIVSGSGTTWGVSISQTVGTESMSAVIADDDDETVRIDQSPSLVAPNILVSFQ